MQIPIRTYTYVPVAEEGRAAETKRAQKGAYVRIYMEWDFSALLLPLFYIGNTIEFTLTTILMDIEVMQIQSSSTKRNALMGSHSVVCT